MIIKTMATSVLQKKDGVTTNDEHMEINKFVIVKYEGELFPGVTVLKEDGARVSAMAKRDGRWFWPKIPDEIDYCIKE